MTLEQTPIFLTITLMHPKFVGDWFDLQLYMTFPFLTVAVVFPEKILINITQYGLCNDP